MERLFVSHSKRRTQLLNRAWLFATDPDNRGEEEHWFDCFPAQSSTVIVPSCWNHELGLYEYEGIAWYQCQFYAVSRSMLIEFGAVTGFCKVYLNGSPVGEHYGGFTAFTIPISIEEPGLCTLTVRVDNTSSKDTIPLRRVDWYPYGGILRAVEVHEVPHIYIGDFCADYALSPDLAVANISVSFSLTNPNPGEETTGCKLYIDGKLIAEMQVTVEGTQEVTFDQLHLQPITLWEPENPILYALRLETDFDDMIERVGFRTIAIRDGRFYLNNRSIYRKGVNRHEDHPDWGFAFPAKLMKRDIDIIRDMGCNTIRGSHYPNSPLFLDYLDQEGILFWSEIPLWGYSETHLSNPIIHERGIAMHREMIAQYRNHPSIIIWGLFNEIDTRCQVAYDLTAQFAALVRSLDGSRLVTFTSNRVLEDICLPFVDFISINYYAGWFQGKLEEWAGFLDKVRERRDTLGLGSMPIVISEFGCAALYGCHTFENNRWTEEYQSHLMTHTIELFQNDPTIAGHFIWQFCDIRTSENISTDRVRGFNNKGILNEYRKPKQAYYAVRQLHREGSVR